MNCQHVRQLLAFVDRKCEELDPAERDAVKQHLEQCAECAAVAQSERSVDAALGTVMRDVDVPAALKANVLKRLAAERGKGRWKWAAGAVAATLLIAAVTAGIIWQARQPISVVQNDLEPSNFFVDHPHLNQDPRAYLAKEGLPDVLPQQFDLRFLQYVEVVEFKGRRIAKLAFSRGNDRAVVLILPAKHYRTTDLREDPTNLEIQYSEDRHFIFLILFRGNLSALYHIHTAV